MKPEWKQKWIEALRSKKYVQGRGRLRTTSNRFCCLGVLCDLVNPYGWTLNPDYEKYYEFYGRGAYAPESVLDVTGLTTAAQIRLACMNDHEYYTFDMISDWIEANL